MKLGELTPNAAELALCSTGWLDPYWDSVQSLLHFPADYTAEESRTPEVAPPNVKHGVRETVNYVIGLLLRGGAGDDDRARAALRRVVQFQFDEPGAVYHGTFFRYPQEPRPGAGAIMWKDYDPNWRQFIGTMFALILDDFADRLDNGLIAALEQSIRLAVVGETDRVEARYTNIALMKAALDVWAGDRFNKQDWIDRGVKLSDEIDALFEPNQTFPEYNSPTYYGVNLAALRHWRRSPSSILRQRGQIMEAELWRDIGRFYHAGMKNLCGPFDRSYGMDMRHYASLIGLWIWLETGRAEAPFPGLRTTFEHRHDFGAAPLAALLGTEIPDDVRPGLHAFDRERFIERTIENGRIATAWIDQRVMFGGQRGNRAANSQYHPATIHWLTPDGDVGTLHLTHSDSVDATASNGRLEIAGAPSKKESKCTLEINCPNGEAIIVDSGTLGMPGLTLQIKTTLGTPVVEHTANRVILTFAIAELQRWQMTLRQI